MGGIYLWFLNIRSDIIQKRNCISVFWFQKVKTGPMGRNNGDKFLLNIRKYFLVSVDVGSGMGIIIVGCPTARELFRVALDRDAYR